MHEANILAGRVRIHKGAVMKWGVYHHGVLVKKFRTRKEAVALAALLKGATGLTIRKG